MSTFVETIEYLEAEIKQLRAALILLYDKWENGDPCYQDPEDCTGYLGHAFKLTLEEENQILALIKRGEEGK